MTTFTIQDFFSRKFEVESTNILINKSEYFSSQLIEEYVNQLMNYNLQSYIDYLVEHPNMDEITSRDITQLSSIDDCTYNMCKMMLTYGNEGLLLTDIASNLHGTDNYKDNIVALTKYGENQVKTASQMGLTIFCDDRWYLSAIGKVYCNLSESRQRKLIAINLLRDPFYSKVILALLERDTSVREFMSILSETTQKRRSSSCMKVMSFFIAQCEAEEIQLYNLSSK